MKMTQPSFAAGELSPSLWSRVDFAKFHVGSKVLKNMIVLAEGGILNRPGLQFIGKLDDGDDNVRLIPFEFNTDQTYMLVFTDENMRVLKGDGFVLDGAGPAIYEQASPYASEDLKLVRFSQSADTLFLTHPDYLPYTLTRTAHDAWTFSPMDFSISTAAPLGVSVTPPGSSADDETNYQTVTYQVFPWRTATAQGVGSTVISLQVRNPWVGSVTLTASAPSGAGPSLYPNGYDIFKNGAFYRAKAASGLGALNFTDTDQGPSGSAHSAGTFYATPPRYFSGAYSEAISGDVSPTIDHRYTVSAVVNGSESLPSLEVVGASDRPWTAGETIVVAWDPVPEATLYNVYKNTSGQWGWVGTIDMGDTLAKAISLVTATTSNPYVLTAAGHNFVTGDLVDIRNILGYPILETPAEYTVTVIDADHFSLNGTSAVTTSSISQAGNNATATLARAPTLQFIDDNILPDTSYGFRKLSPYDFITEDNYPVSVALFQQRLMFGGQNNAPTTVYGSRIGSLLDFSISDPQRVDDPFSVIPASGKVNGIRHLVPLNELIIFTAGSEISLRGSDGAIKNGNQDFDFQSYIGCAEYPAPIPVNKSILFAQRDGKRIHDYAFKLEADGFTGTDLTALATHSFKDSKVVSMAYQQSPFGVLWCIREDGTLRAMTYLREHDVFAWHRHDTDGLFKSVGAITGADQDDLYFIVKRTIDGDPVWYVEKMVDRDPLDPMFLDSALSYDGSPATVFSDLDHLEGKTVNAISDGNVHFNLTVTAGAVTLPQAGSVVHIGLPYVSELQTLDFDNGRNQGMKQKISRVTVRLLETRGGLIGPDANNLLPIPYRAGEDYNQPTDLFSGDKDQSLTASWGKTCKLTIRQSSPLPITILALIPDVEADA